LRQPIKLDQFAPRVALGEASAHGGNYHLWEIAENLHRWASGEPLSMPMAGARV
jgi:hypothetical protein